MGSPSLSRLRVLRYLEIQNRVTKYWTWTRTGGGDKSGGTRTGGGDESGGTRTGGEDESGGTRTGGGYMLQVNSDWRDGSGYVVVYMDSDWR